MERRSKKKKVGKLSPALQCEDQTFLPKETDIPKTQVSLNSPVNINNNMSNKTEKSTETTLNQISEINEQKCAPENPPPNKTFNKKPGTTDKGKSYENMLTAITVLQMVTDDKIKDFFISADDPNYGAFDDLVIEIHTDRCTETKAVQLKHSERKSLATQRLTSIKGNFSIFKYFNSFKEIQSKPQQLILYTNLIFDISVDTTFQFEGEKFCLKPVKLFNPDETLKFSQDINYYYQFQIVENEWTEQNRSKVQEYEEFFKKFCLYSDRENLQALQNSTMKKFTQTFSSNIEIFEKYSKFISDWCMKEKTKEKLNKKWMQRVISLLLLGSHIEPLSFGLVNDKMKIFREAFDSFNITLLEKNDCELVSQLWSDIDTHNIDLKEMNILRLNYRFSSDTITDIKKLDGITMAQLLWLMNKCPLLVKKHEHVEKIIQLCPYGKFVLLGEEKSREWMVNYSVFKKLLDLKLKKPELYKKILETFTISVQGKEELSLEVAFEKNEEFLKYVTTDNLLEMLQGPCSINGEKETPVDPYIERHLSQNIVDVKYLETVADKAIIVVNRYGTFDKIDLKKYQLVDIHNMDKSLKKSECCKSMHKTRVYLSKNKFSDFEFQNVCDKISKFKSNKPVHFFKYLDGGKLEWIRSKGDISDMNKHKIIDDNLLKSENEFWSSDFSTNIKLIIGDPGMGKTELLKSLKNKCPAKYWTVTISLTEVNNFFQNFKETFDYIDDFQMFIVDQKFSSLKQLDQQFFKLCLKQKLVIYVWDAFDEIPSKYRNVLSRLIFNLSEKGFIQLISTRRHLRSFLEKEFNVLSISIGRFCEIEQKYYIKQRLESIISADNIEKAIEKIENTFAIIEHVDILGIPLQIFMLTELIRQNGEKYLELLNKTFLLTDLYHYFIQEKFKIFFNSKTSFDLQGDCAGILEDFKEQTLKYYKKLAFKVVFSEDVIKELNLNCEKCKPKVLKYNTSIGLITKLHNNRPQFLHGSFAEYLIAVYFSTNFNTIPKDIFFCDKYANVRFFFDMLMAEKSPVHISILYKDFELLKTYACDVLKCKDKGGRSALHLICSWGQKYPRLQATQNKETYSIEDNKSFDNCTESQEYSDAVRHLLNQCDVSEEDDLLKMTPLLYARKSESLGAEMQILERSALDLKHACPTHERINTLYYSALRGYDELFVKFSTEETSSITVDFGRTLLFIAAENGHKKIVEYLLKSGAEIDLPDRHGRTPLFAASSNGHKETVKCLIKFNASMGAVDTDGRTPLHIASSNGHKKTVEFLVKSGAEVNRADNYGRTPLLPASLNGYKKTVECLVQNEARVNNADVYGRTPLFVASEYGHAKTTRYLVKVRAEINHTDRWGQTALYAASENGREITVKYLVKSGAEINRADEDGRTPLYMASCTGHKNIVEYLVKSGAEINRADNYGRTPLLPASLNGYKKTVECLVRYGAEVNYPDMYSRTPLFVASEYGHEDIVRHLENVGAQINHRDKWGQTALFAASQNGHKRNVKFLVESGAKINGVDKNKRTPLYIASEHGHEKTVEYLVKAGAQINRTDMCGRIPLLPAALKGHEKTVQCLVDFGSEINHSDMYGRTPLYVAAEHGHENIVQYLVKLGADINICDNYLQTPLYAASENGHEGNVEFLVSCRADVNRASNQGRTPLQQAACNGHEKIVEYLLKSGAEVNHADVYGRTPLYVASVYGHEEIVEYLVHSGADVNGRDEEGQTPLYAACENGHVEVVQFLVESGADVNCANKIGRRPLTVACRNRHGDISKYLLECGAS